jgi:UrcA family protein
MCDDRGTGAAPGRFFAGWLAGARKESEFMSIRNASKGLAVAGLAAMGLAMTAPGQPAQAQPYGYDYSNDSGGQITVYAPHRRIERNSITGAEIDVARESRVVHYGDLDLSSAYGVRRLHDRIERAAVDACQDMDNTPGLYVMDSDVDCIGGAVDRAMAEAPIPENAAYQGYGYRYRY